MATALRPAMSVMYRSVWERLLAAPAVLLISPAHPDGDSVGSICGLRAALASMGKHATLYCPDALPAVFDRIPFTHEVRVGAAALRGRQFDAIVICDASDLAYTGVADDLMAWRAPGSTLIVVDHHATNAGYGDLPCVLPTASSTTQVITGLLQANRVRITSDAATALLFGIVTDTDAFTNPATSPATLATAATLTAAGARIGPILRAVYQSKPLAALQLWGRALERLTEHPRWGIATTVLLPEDLREFSGAEGRSEGLSNFLQAVIPARAILVLKDTGTGTVRGSFRTQRDDVDLGKLAARFGGGGHRKASGFEVPGRIVRSGDHWCVRSQ